MDISNSRRQFIKKAALGMTGAALVSSCTKNKQNTATSSTSSSQTYEWKMVTTWPKNFPGLGTGANDLAKTIEELTSGQIKVKVFGAGELVPALGAFDAVKRGTAEMFHGASYYWKGKHEAAQFFAAVPFGLNAQEMNAWLYHGGGITLWEELYKQFGLQPFPAGNTGVQMAGWFNREIKSLADFKGLKMRIPGLGGEVLRRLGATVVTLPGGEIFQSLQSGTIDATEFVGPYNDLAFGLYKAAKYYYWPGWHEPGTTLECTVNLKVFESLPKHLQKAVRIACEATNQRILSEYERRNVHALDTLVRKHKVQIRKLPESTLKSLGKTSMDVVAEIANKDKFSKKVFESFNLFRKSAGKWHRLAESGYADARDALL